MRFSIYINPQTAGPAEDVALVDLSIERALRATEAGFDGIALTEHHVSGYNTFGDNFLLAAHLVPQVKRGTRLSLSIVVPQLHHLVRLAQQCNLLDILCRGELLIEMGAGGSPLEFAALGRNPTNRHAEMMEVIEAVEKLLAKRLGEPPVEWSTTYDKGLVSTRIMPTSYLPVGLKFARAAQSDEGVIWTARRGWYLMTARAPLEEIASRLALYRQELDRTDLDQAKKSELLGWSSLSRQLVIGQSDLEAAAHARVLIARQGENRRKGMQLVKPAAPGSPSFTAEWVGASTDNPDAFMQAAMLVGSPETISRKIEESRAAGVHHLMLCFNFGHMTKEQADRQLSLFLSDVYPRFASGATEPRKRLLSPAA